MRPGSNSLRGQYSRWDESYPPFNSWIIELVQGYQEKLKQDIFNAIRVHKYSYWLELQPSAGEGKVAQLIKFLEEKAVFPEHPVCRIVLFCHLYLTGFTKVERSGTPVLGLQQYGVHINGFVEAQDGKKSIWLQRRSKTKQTYPGKLGRK